MENSDRERGDRHSDDDCVQVDERYRVMMSQLRGSRSDEPAEQAKRFHVRLAPVYDSRLEFPGSEPPFREFIPRQFESDWFRKIAEWFRSEQRVRRVVFVHTYIYILSFIYIIFAYVYILQLGIHVPLYGTVPVPRHEMTLA